MLLTATSDLGVESVQCCYLKTELREGRWRDTGSLNIGREWLQLVVLQDQSLLKQLWVQSSRMCKTALFLPIWKENVTVETRPGSSARRPK